MRWKIGLLGCLLMLVSIVKAATINNVRFNRMENKVQVVLDVSEPPIFNQFSLANPPRIVLDFPNTKYTVRGPFAIRQGAVLGVRMGVRSSFLRVVLDLTKTTRTNIYTMPPDAQGHGYRVVLDVYDSNLNSNIALTSVNEPLPVAVFAGGPLDSQKDYQQTINPSASPISPIPSVSPTRTITTTKPIPTSVSPTAPTNINPNFSPNFPISNTAQTTSAQAPMPRPKLTEVPVRSNKKSTRFNKRAIVVCIDPGHGGKDPGANYPKLGAWEKNVVLAIGKRLRSLLNARSGYKVMMTRDRDIFIPLYERPRKCRAAGGDLFVSIHADSVESREPSGASVYILSTHGASSQLAKYLANTENAVDLKWGVDVNKYDDDIQEALLNIQQEATLESSNILAGETLGQLAKVGNVHKNSVERANFVVLRSPEIPSMLVETGFISNPIEAKRLMNPRYQDKIARGIAEGIDAYFQQHLPQHMLLEQ